MLKFAGRTIVVLGILHLLLAIGCTSILDNTPRTIEPHKECPLCGMFPARYPQFQCQIVFQDGSYHAFDSATGLLVYLRFPEKTGLVVKKIQAVYFKDFEQDKWIESQQTYLVFGSGVMGPMGLELIPTNDKKRAVELLKQENGKEIIHFKQVDRENLIKAANEGWLHNLAKKIILE